MRIDAHKKIVDALKDVLGSEHVLCGAETARWATDWTGKYKSDPIAVVRPGSTKDVSRILELANEFTIPVIPVSGNTGLVGGTFATGGIMLSMERLNKIKDIDANARVAVVEAGVILSDLQDAANAVELSFPLSFGAQGSAMIGGCLATNAGGSNVLRYGNARDLCLGLEVVLPSGEIMDILSRLHKDNSGFNLKHLMIGSEGTLGIITAAALKLAPQPKAYVTAMIAMDSLESALALLHHLQDTTSGAVEAFEYMPRNYIEAHLKHSPDARPPFEILHDVNILTEIGVTASQDALPNNDGSLPVANLLVECLDEWLEDGRVKDAVVATNELQRRQMWSRREVAVELARAHPHVVPNDIALPLSAIAPFLERVKQRLELLDPNVDAMVVAHLGDGNIHYAVHPSSADPDIHSKITEAVEEEVIYFGGSFSAEHGIGLSKKASMMRRKDARALQSMRAIKGALDPNMILNPGKVIPQ